MQYSDEGYGPFSFSFDEITAQYLKIATWTVVYNSIVTNYQQKGDAPNRNRWDGPTLNIRL